MNTKATGYVLIDMDGVVADWVGALLKLAKDRLGISRKYEDVLNYRVELPKEVFSWPNEVGYWEGLEVLPDAKTFMKEIRALTDKWYFYTSTGTGYTRAAYEKRKWVKKNFKIDGRRVVICDDKPGFIRPGDIILDDKPSNVQGSIEKGAYGFLIKQPWNMSVLDPKPVSLLEALEKIKVLLKKID